MALERILATGDEGTGKTRALLEIAKALPDSIFYVAETDPDAYARMTTADFKDLDNIGVRSVKSWSDFASWTEWLVKEAEVTPGKDWCVLDRADPLWEYAQDWASLQLYGQSALERKSQRLKDIYAKGKDAMAVSAFDQAGWDFVNSHYREAWNRLNQLRTHLYFITATARIYPNDPQAEKLRYGFLGAKPAGKKELRHEPHTVLFFADEGDKYTITTVKDRERPKLDHYQVKNFYVDYLLKVAKFK